MQQIVKKFFFIFLLLACAGADLKDPPSPKVKILALLPLSGPEAHQGATARHGIEFALRDPAAAEAVEVVFEDSLSDIVRSMAVYRAGRRGRPLQAVLTLGSPIAMALAPLANADQVLLFAMAANPAYSTPDDFTYRLIGSAEEETSFLASVLKKRVGESSLAVVYQESDYGLATSTAFLKHAALAGLSVVHQESFLPKSSDYRAQLTRIKAKAPKALYMAFYGEDAGVFVRQAKEIGLQAQLYCSQACTNPDLIRAGGKSAEGFLVSTSYDRVGNNERSSFEAQFGEQMTYVATRYYLVVKALAAGWRRCQTASAAPECLRRFLHEQAGRDGIPTFDTNGDIIADHILLAVQGGRFVPHEDLTE